MSDSKKTPPPGDVSAFAILQELMATHPNQQLVETLHGLLVRSQALNPLYARGSWEYLGRVKRG